MYSPVVDWTTSVSRPFFWNEPKNHSWSLMIGPPSVTAES
jgi:hypothetical protein